MIESTAPTARTFNSIITDLRAQRMRILLVKYWLKHLSVSNIYLCWRFCVGYQMSQSQWTVPIHCVILYIDGKFRRRKRVKVIGQREHKNIINV